MHVPKDPEKAGLLRHDLLLSTRLQQSSKEHINAPPSPSRIIIRRTRTRTAALLLFAGTLTILLGLWYIWGSTFDILINPFMNMKYRYNKPIWPEEKSSTDSTPDAPLPVVVWHGLGDWYGGQAAEVVEEAALSAFGYNTFVHRIRFNEDESKDRAASFFENISEQLDNTCEMFKNSSVFDRGFVGVGLSQGGLFLRILQQACPFVKMVSLITLGSPHQGIDQFTAPFCKYIPYLCESHYLRSGLLMYALQSRIVPLTYFKPHELHDAYLKGSELLGRFNYETSPDETSQEKINQLKSFVVVMFKNDSKLFPARSAWFDDLDGNGEHVDMVDTSTYKNIGLDKLDQSERLHRLEFEGDHLQFSKTQIQDIFCQYVLHGKDCNQSKSK